MLAALPGNHHVSLFDAATGKEVRRIVLGNPGENEVAVVQLVFAPDGRHLAVHQLREIISLVNVHTGKETMRLRTGSDYRRGLAFSPDGRLLAAGVLESIDIWDTVTGQMVLRLDGHRGSVRTVAFGADGRTLLSAGEDSQVYLWTLRPRRVGAGKQMLDALWRDLGAADASAAYRAIWGLSEHDGAAKFLRAKIAPLEPVAKKRLAELLADLDCASFEKREAASRALAELGDRAQAALELALAKPSSLEFARRAHTLLGALGAQPTGLRLQQLRAVQAMELAATPAAHRLIEQWSQGADGAPFTEAARAALRRLNARR